MKINSKTHIIGVTAAVVVMAFTSGILLIMGGIAGELRQAIGTTGLINQYDRSFNAFVHNELSNDEMLNIFSEMEVALTQKSKTEIVQKFKNQRQIIESIGKIHTENEKLKEEADILITDSIKQSNAYIEEVVAKMIASSTEDLSLVEKQVIVGASRNTNFNYQLQTKLNNLGEDSTAQEAFMTLINEMIKNVKADVEFLKDTTFAQLPKIALQNNEKIKQIMSTYLENQNKANAYQTQIISENGVLIKETNKLMTSAMDSAVTRIVLMLMLMSAMTIIGFSVLTYFSRHAILKPLSKMSNQALGIAEMNLDFVVDEKILGKKDEIGALAASFDKMQRNLSEIVRDLKASSHKVAINAEFVSNFNQDLAQGVEEQASALEEISATVEHTTKKIAQSTSNIEEAFKDANYVTADAEKGRREMVEMLLAMKEISESSTKISKVIKVIDDIAFQTNILALNAAVEAARAGQHGKGFAVVAEEVRNLAARSANAAKETTEMIESVLGKIEGGERIAKQTSEALEQMVLGIHKISDSIAEISSVSQDEAIAMQQINLAITQVAEVVQGNTAISEEVSAISQEMFSQSEELKDNTARFKLPENHTQNGTIQLEEERLKHSQDMSTLRLKKTAAHTQKSSITKPPVQKPSEKKEKTLTSMAAGDEEDDFISLDDNEFDRYR